MYCTKCGSEFNGNFCPKCGAQAKRIPPPISVNNSIKKNINSCPLCGGKISTFSSLKLRDKSIICNKCATDINISEDLVKLQTLRDVSEHLSYRQENKKLFDSFHVTQHVSYKKHTICVDQNKKLWYYATNSKLVNPPIFKFNELADFELIEDGGTIIKSKGGVGRAVAGGLLFGGVGAIVGSTTSKKESNSLVHDLKITIYIGNRYHNKIVIPFISYLGKGGYKKEDYIYKQSKKASTQFISLLNLIQSQGQVQPVYMSQAPMANNSSIDELKKLKELLDSGIITQSDFEAKKKQLLGI